MICILGTIFAGLLGLAFGSFLNVCLSRWPLGESVVLPRSHCRQCGRTLAWWENLPLVSWLALGGRCRTCRAWIGWRYPLVELAVAALWATSAWRFLSMSLDPNATAMDFYAGLADAASGMIFYWLLIALAMLDAEHLWLPDWLTLPGAALGFVFTLLRAGLLGKPASSSPALFHYGLTAWLMTGAWRPLFTLAFQRLVEIFAAAALILLIRWLYWIFRRREGIGLGDAKLMALLAAWLGLPGALVAFGLGVVLGALAALVLLAATPSARRQSEVRDQSEGWAAIKLPLGTFLCIGGVVSSLWGEPIIAAYLRWAGF
jgi:leader peptidase (prepilin peptidase)/N-methyltransferase